MKTKAMRKNNKKINCPKGKYWVHPFQRKRTTKDGRTYVQHVKGYCCSSHSPYQKLAKEEKLPLDYLYYALTIYGEARGENDTSKRAIAWIIRNRFIIKKGGSTYQKVVLKKSQFSCWRKSDINYRYLRHPGKANSSDKKAWAACKIIMKEIKNASKTENPLPGIYNYFSGQPKRRWEKDYFDLPDVPNFHFVKTK